MENLGNVGNYVGQITSMAIQYAPTLLMAILTLIIGLWIIGQITNLVGKLMVNRGIDINVRPFFTSIVNVGLKIMLMLTVAEMFGIKTTSFIAIFGALAFAVGMALQGSLGHFASGVLLLIFKPYKVGDLISVQGQTGEVESIQVFNTVLKTLDNKRIIIPNGVATSGVITNISGQGKIRVDMQFNTAASENIDKVRNAVRQVAASCPYILKDEPVDVLVNGHEIGITKYDVRPWCKSEHYWDVYYFMQENIKRSFESNGIKSPTPAMNVQVTNN
jgi:small conductance mechanosensitive channel